MAESTSASAGSSANAGLPTKTASAQSSATTRGSSVRAQGSGEGGAGLGISTTSRNTVETSTAAKAGTDLPNVQQSGPVLGGTLASSTDSAESADSATPSGTGDTKYTSENVPLAPATDTSSGSDPTTDVRSDGDSTDPAVPSQTSLNALSILTAALSSSTTVLTLPLVVTSSLVQSADSDPGASAYLSTVETAGLPPPLTQEATSAVFTASGQTYTAYYGSGGPGGISVSQSGSTAAIGSGNSAVLNGETVITVPGGLLVGGSQTFALPQQPTQASAVLVSSQAYNFISHTGDPTAVVVANGGSSITLTAGAAAATLDGQVVSAPQSGGAVIGTGSLAEAVQQAPTSAQDPGEHGGVAKVGSETLTAHPVSNGLIVEYEQTTATLLTGGAAATLGTQVVSADASGQLVAGFSTITLQPNPYEGALLTLGSSVFTASDDSGSSAAVVIGGNTLSAGGSAQAIGKQAVSVGSDGIAVDGTRTIALSDVTPAVSTDGIAILLTLSSSTLTLHQVPGRPGEVAAGDFILSAGGPDATIDGQMISEGSGGLVLGGSSTVSLPQVVLAAESGAVLTLGSSLVTATPVPGRTGEVALDGTTFSVGGPARSISGEVLSEAPSGLVVGGSTTIGLSRLATSSSPMISQSIGTDSPEMPLPSTTSIAGRTVGGHMSWVVTMAVLVLLYFP
ncbi:hypothetical protein LTR08_006532 [Meristemomyces frigidus]|nr:hypothetical protein LTR08_006532 [Meristemomyces frigidus]